MADFEYRFPARIERVVDGDTYDVIADLGFNVFKRIRVRLNGLDTAETWRPRNDAEREHGMQATAMVEAFAATNPNVMLVTHKVKASIFGRYSADVYFTDEVGRVFSLARRLLEAGMQKRDSY